MHICVRLMGLLKERTPRDGQLELPEPATIRDALAALQIPRESVQVCTVNGRIVHDRSYTLRDGDELLVLPPVGGG